MLNKLKQSFYFLLFLNVILVVGITWWASPIELRDVLQLETTSSHFEAQQILAFWESQGLLPKLELFIILSVLYIPFYMLLLIAAMIKFTIPTKNEIFIKAGRFFSMLLMVAVFCELIEFYSLFHLIQNGINDWNLKLSYDMASTKYSILIVVLLLIVICITQNFINKILPEEKKHYFNSKP